MLKLHASFMALVLLCLTVIVLPTTAGAQTLDPKTHPGVWQDIITAPAPEGAYGKGFTSTERVVERCTAFEWAIRHGKNGAIRWYRRNYQTGYCLGWINAAMAFLNFHDKDGNHTLGVCMPEEIESVEVVKTFLDYVHKNPDQIKYNPSLLIYWSVLEKYPCKS